MSDFWTRMLGEGEAPAQPAQTPPPAPTAQQTWWQRGLLPPQPPAEPVRQPPADQEPTGPSQTPERTQWSRQQESACPGCGSDMYWSHPEAPQARARCYTCGYPQVQSGSGPVMRGQTGGEVQAARQTAAASTSNYNPGRIFHHM